ncbi:MAG: hypothetical protein ACJAXL_001626, partial [Alphaproteobacteria bacterium]
MPLNMSPISVKNLPSRYNVLYQKSSLEDDVGAIKIAGRAIRNLGLNKHVARAPNTLGEIGHFLSRHENSKIEDLAIIDIKKPPNLFTLTTKAKTLHFPKTNDYYHLYQDKNKSQYYLWVPAHSRNTHTMIRIKANSDNECQKKIFDILSTDTSRAKLECQTTQHIYGKLPFLPGHEIFYNEHKMTGNLKEHGFDRIGDHYNHSAFDTKIGAVDQNQLAYYFPSDNLKNYSNRADNVLNVKDDTFNKLHASSVFADSGTEIDEIVGNIVLQTYAGKKPEPEYVAQMSKKIKDDYIYDTYGIDSRGGKARQSPFPFVKIKAGQFGSRYQFANDPFGGGRFWQDQPMSHTELVRTLYQPQSDGTTKFLYDRDPEKFMQLADKMTIKKVDRQYLMSYGRKAIGARIAINFIQDELMKINLDDPKLSPEQKDKAKIKQLDLIRFQSKLFDSLGDLKDSFRKSGVGFAAYARAVGQEDIPDIKEDQALNRVTQGIPSKEGFVKSANTALGDYVENYAYFEEFWGWQGREYVGRFLFNLFKNELFDAEVPDIVADNAVGMLAGIVDRSSRRMKSFSEFYLKDADLASNAKTFIERAKRLDLGGLSEIMRLQKSNINEFFEGRKSYARTNVKRMILQNEGVSHDKEIWPTYNLKYQGNQRGRFNANIFAHVASWKKAEKTSGDLRPLLIDIARFMKAHQKSLQLKGVKSKASEYQ